MMDIIKFVVTGVWLSAITLGTAYGVMSWRAEQAVEEKDMAAKDWFLSIWNHGTPEWMNEIDELYKGLRFGELADL